DDSELLDRLLLASAISRIDSREREILAILTTGLCDPDGDVRFLSALALSEAPLRYRRWVENELTGALADRNLRVQTTAGEALERLRARIDDAREKLASRNDAPAAVPQP